ncbi:hypothetical protein KS4_32320 [Poriferisphaera corsica]|uniref:Uncharacterized protein n=1 Tax=Poriferisphaera corsica TaxID=2528020 RepID=A0A517YY37_9BACT|nr:hypothetical protein [Poriferisphaera corsica]QDU35152.1 hypothetical protein KS4_32320 [Poriferisphaera corsica]
MIGFFMLQFGLVYDEKMTDESTEMMGPMADYFWRKWLLGGVFTAFLFFVGAYAIVFAETALYFPTRYRFYYRVPLEGVEAVLVDVCEVMLGLMFHFGMFWKYQKKLEQYYQPLLYLTSVAFGGCVLLTAGYSLWTRFVVFM